MYFNERLFWKYTNNVYTNSVYPSKEDIPYILEHVFDIVKGDYVKNSNQCCYYSPTESSNYKVSILNNKIISYEDGFIIGENYGQTKIKLIDNVNHSELEFMVSIIKNKNISDTSKNILFLKKGDMIDLDIVLKHINCKHYMNCIWEKKLWDIYSDEKYHDLIVEINEINRTITDYRNIIEAYHNNEIIYHPTLDKYYNIQINKKNINSTVKHTIDVSVDNNFSSIIRDKIKELKLSLRYLNHQRI